MKLISSNQKHVLFSNQDTTFLLEADTFQNVGQLELPTKLGHLQYGTGIAALVNSSKVRLYDFLFSKELYELETFLKIHKVALFKNLLIVVSEERVLVHDLKSKNNKCYIPIQQGQLSFLSEDYYSLKISYFTDTHLITSREFWLNKTTQIEGVTFTLAAYSRQATTAALVLKNVLSIYQGNKLLTLYGFNSNVQQLVVAGDYFFVKLQDGSIIGCSQQQQVSFLEHEEIELDFWDHEYDTVLFGSKEALYEVCKGVVKKYRLDRVQPCTHGESKSMVKGQSGKETEK